MQGSLVDSAGLSGDRRTIALSFEGNRHPTGLIGPALVEVAGHYDLVSFELIRRQPLFYLRHGYCLIPLYHNRKTVLASYPGGVIQGVIVGLGHDWRTCLTR